MSAQSALEVRVATMYRLGWKGNVTAVQLCMYHSPQWETLVETGWITHAVDHYTLADISRLPVA